MKKFILVSTLIIAGAMLLIGCNNTDNGASEGDHGQIDTTNKNDSTNKVEVTQPITTDDVNKSETNDTETNVTPEDLYEYEEVSGGLLLTKYLGNEIEITVPSIIGNKKVISTGTIFSGNVLIEKIVLPDSVTFADLSGCEKLVSVKATGIQLFKDIKLSGCNSLKYLDLSGLKSMLNLSLPDSLEELHLNNATGKLPVYTLKGAQLKTLVIPKADEIYVGYYQWSCKLTNVTISENMKYYHMSSDTNAPGIITCESERGILITDENAAYVYCSIFKVDEITVNGVLYKK